MEKLTADYRDYTKPDRLPKGRLIESEGVQMHVVDGGERTVVIPRAFHAYSGSAFEQLRDRVIADTLDAQVIGIDIPGVGLNLPLETSPLYRKEASQGSLTLRSETMLKALVEGLELTEGQELDLYWLFVRCLGLRRDPTKPYFSGIQTADRSS